MEAKLSGQAITVAVVEDEPLLRDLLRVALQQHAGLEVVGVFSQGEQALRHIPRLQPQVALLDIDLGKGLRGAEPACQHTLFARHELGPHQHVDRDQGTRDVAERAEVLLQGAGHHVLHSSQRRMNIVHGARPSGAAP